MMTHFEVIFGKTMPPTPPKWLNDTNSRLFCGPRKRGYMGYAWGVLVGKKQGAATTGGSSSIGG